MVTQYSGPGSGPQPWGTISLILWGALLACGIWAIFRLKQQTKFRVALGLMILGQLLLHMIYGEETFLYSIHFAPLLVILAALGTLTRMRLVVLMLAGALVLSMAINNGLQFGRATNVVNCLKQNDTRIIAEPLFSLPSSASAEEKQPLDKAKLIATCGGEAQDTGKQARNWSYTDHIARLRR